MMYRLPAWVLVLALVAVFPAFGEDGDASDLEARVTALEEQLAELKAERDKWAGWSVNLSGEFRARALVEANTRNAFTNKGGVTMYAYRGDSTLENDYGWWDYRAQLQLDVDWRDTTRLHTFIEVGNAAWGNQAPIFGGTEDRSFGNTELAFRELYVDVSLVYIPIRLQFGRFRYPLLNRLIWGLENDGLNVYFQNDFLRAGFIGIRQYEGERYEFSMSYNDDEDTFIVYVESNIDEVHALNAVGYLTLYELPRDGGNEPDVASPLYNVPHFDPEKYDLQGNALYNVGLNYVADWPRFRLNVEGDVQWGKIKGDGGAPDIQFKGFAAYGKFDYRPNDLDVLALTVGYGSGDDPNTVDFEGYFAPDNDLGVRDDNAQDYIDRGYFAVYEHLSPGAGVPGGLFDDRGTGGIENTIFALLGWDMRSQANHHYYLGVGGIWAAEPNPHTGDRTIGIEVDASIDYHFSDHVVFRVYGGHLFVLGDYFRPDAYDAASIYFEWKVHW